MMRAYRSLLSVAAWLALIGLPSTARTEQDADRLVAAPPLFARFTVRGRWEHPRALTWRVVTEGGPFSSELLERVVAEALETWELTGVVGFSRAEDDEQPSFTISWHGVESIDDSCRPFGRDLSVAHSGPVSADTFIHLDASHVWSQGDGEGEPLARTLRHELGHVLGLDHCADPSALMAPATIADAPTASDLAGLHSLYGGYHDGPGDMEIRRVGSNAATARADRAHTLRRIAPLGVSRWTLLDTDGDGDDELLVWRTDATSLGALMIYHFDAEARLDRTLGPMLGAMPPEADTSFRLGPAGERWIVSDYPDGLLRLRRFDENGWPQVATPQQHLAFDRDGTHAVPAATGVTATFGGTGAGTGNGTGDTHEALHGDLDGDGRDELLMRRTSAG